MFTPQFLEVQKILLQPGDRKKCSLISHYIIVQCLIVFVGSATILNCLWTPANAYYDYDKLARVMYLFDSHACGYSLNIAKSFSNLQLSNDTHSYKDIQPIKWLPPIIAVSTRLSEKTRKYIKISLGFHVIWILAAIIHWVFAKNCTEVTYFKIVLDVFFYICVCVLIFDVSMAIVYITHIKQSLTKSTVLRYSGWSTNIKLESYEDFAGWLPMMASVCWLRGLVFFGLNIYCAQVLANIMKKIRKREVKLKYSEDVYMPIPEGQRNERWEKDTLVFSSGELKPHKGSDRAHLLQ